MRLVSPFRTAVISLTVVLASALPARAQAVEVPPGQAALDYNVFKTEVQPSFSRRARG